MPDQAGMPTEGEWLEGRYPGAQEDDEASPEPRGHCVIHGDYWTEDCLRCYPPPDDWMPF